MVLPSCAVDDRKPLSILDSSQHHTYTGIVMMNQGKFDDARREFDLAIELNDREAKSLAGTALIKAYQGEFESAFDYMGKAEKFARRSDDRLFVHIGKMRLYTMSRHGRDWISEARTEFESAVAINSRSSAAYFYMGRALKMNYKFQEAGVMFVKVLDLNDEHVEDADREWKLIKKILEAQPETQAGKRIAISEAVTRAETAALLIEELELDELYKGLGIQTQAVPSGIVLSRESSRHIYQRAIDGILQIGVKGLERYPDGGFHPDDLVTRAVLAVSIVDILEKITKGRNFAAPDKRYADLYPHLSSDLPFYEEIIAVISIGIMDAGTMTSSRLAPYEPLSGVDALITLKKLKGVLLNL